MEDIEKGDFLRPPAMVSEDMGPYATRFAEPSPAAARQSLDAAIAESLTAAAPKTSPEAQPPEASPEAFPETVPETPPPETPPPETPPPEAFPEASDNGQDDLPDSVRPLAEKAARFDRMQEILRHHEISGEEMDAALGLSLALRNDPVRALEQLTPLVARLQEIAGASLPEDLHNAVLEGAITEPLARELAQSRAQQRLSQQHSQKQAERYTAHLHDAAAAAAAHWEGRMRATDPGFAARLDAVQAIARGILASEGLPPGEDGLVRTLERADARLRAAIQPTVQPATAPVPAPTRTATGSRQPRSLSGAVAMALGER